LPRDSGIVANFVTRSGSVSCAIASNTASCLGQVLTTSIDPTATLQGSETISTVIPNVTGNLVKVTVTSGLQYLPSLSTSRSTGAGPRITQPAVLAGIAAAVGGAVML